MFSFYFMVDQDQLDQQVRVVAQVAQVQLDQQVRVVARVV
jgi:hypothetical protein